MKVRTGLVAVLCAATVGCATTRFAWDYDRDVDFERYHTFDWMSPPGTVEDEWRDFPLMALRLKRAFEHELHAIGYDKVDEDPDFYVAYHAAVGRPLSVSYFNAWRYRYPPRRRPGWHVGVVVGDTYDEGSLILDVIDAQTDELVWRGVARGFPFGHGEPDRREAEDAARAILEAFPPLP
jgi:hypothetical protein